MEHNQDGRKTGAALEAGDGRFGPIRRLIPSRRIDRRPQRGAAQFGSAGGCRTHREPGRDRDIRRNDVRADKVPFRGMPDNIEGIIASSHKILLVEGRADGRGRRNDRQVGDQGGSAKLSPQTQWESLVMWLRAGSRGTLFHSVQAIICPAIENAQAGRLELLRSHITKVPKRPLCPVAV